MKYSTNLTLSVLTLASMAACGTDTLRFTDEGNPVENTGGSENGPVDDGSGGTELGTGGMPSSGGMNTGAMGPGGGNSVLPEPEPSPSGGAGGSDPGPAPFIEGDSRIVDIEVTDEGLFWVEYGTYDDLDNYQYDGKLLHLAPGATEPSVLAEDLHGPTTLGVTSDEIYITVDESILNSAAATEELWRYDRTTTDVDYVMDGHGLLTTFGSEALFAGGTRTNREEIWTLDDASAPVLLHDTGAHIYSIIATSSTVYFAGPQHVNSLPTDGSGPAVAFEDQPTRPTSLLALHNDQVLAAERGSPLYATSTIQSGDEPWTRFALLSQWGGAEHLMVTGDRYVVGRQGSGIYRFYIGEVNEPESEEFHIVDADRQAWAIDTEHLYEARGSAIYAIVLPE